MIEAITLVAVQVVASGGLSLGTRRLSPWMPAPVRHLFAGAAPLALPFAWMLQGQDSVTLMGPDLAAGAALFGLGVGTSLLLTGRGSAPARDRRKMLHG